MPPFQMGFCLKHDSDGTQCPTLQSTQSVMGLEIASGIAYASSFCFDQIRTSFPGIASNHGCQTQGPCARASSFCVTGESLTSFLLLLKTIEMINNCRGNYVTQEWATGSPRPHSECTNDSFSTPPKWGGGDIRIINLYGGPPNTQISALAKMCFSVLNYDMAQFKISVTSAF